MTTHFVRRNFVWFPPIILLFVSCGESLNPEELRDRAERARRELDAIQIDQAKAERYYPDELAMLAASREEADAAFTLDDWTASGDEYISLVENYMELQSRVDEVAWHIVDGREGADWPVDVLQTPDGDYFVAGVVKDAKHLTKDIALSRHDASGALRWRKTFGGPEDEIVSAVVSDSEGDFIVVGQTSSYKDYGGDVYVLKVDANGEELWSGVFGKSGTDSGIHAAVLPDGGILCVGRTFQGGDGMNVYVIRIDGAGSAEWERFLGGDGDQLVSDAIPVEDGIVIAGVQGVLNQNQTYAFLAKIDFQGEKLWWNQLPLDGFVNPESVTLETLPDDDILVALGFLTEDKQVPAWSGQDAAEDVALIKAGASGEIAWTKTFGGGNWDSPCEVASIPTGEIVIVGTTKSFGAGEEDVLAVKTNSKGKMIWERTMGTAAYETARAALVTRDGGILLAASRKAGRNDSGYDTLLIKTDAELRGWKDGKPYDGTEAAPVSETRPGSPEEEFKWTKEGGPEVGDEAPEIHPESWLNTDDPQSLAKLRGHVVVLEFWATWCPPCIDAIPHINGLIEQYAGKDVTFLSLTDEDREEAEINAFADRHGMEAVIGTGAEGFEKYALTGVPTAFVIDRNGKIAWMGHPMDAQLPSAIDEALGDAETNAGSAQ